MMRRRPTHRLELIYAAVILGGMAGGSLLLDRSGAIVTASVAGKRERIVVGFEPSGHWDRYHEVVAAFDRTDGLRVNAVVRVSRARYDALRAGDSIEVRYLPQFPALARTSDRSTVSVLRDLGSAATRMPVVVWLAAGIGGLWIAARIGRVPVLAVGAAWGMAGWTMLLTPPSRERPRPADAMAEVRAITLVDRSPARLVQTRAHTGRFDTRLDVPYQVVELALPGGTGEDTVLAVDAVDAGSVQGLAVGARLPVRLDPAERREAQLVGGTRRFANANRFHFLVPVLGSALLGTLMGLAYAWRWRSRRTADHRRSMQRGAPGIIQPEGGA